MAFPGGRRSPQDVTDLHTAVREFHEEVGIRLLEDLPDQPELLEALQARLGFPIDSPASLRQEAEYSAKYRLSRRHPRHHHERSRPLQDQEAKEPSDAIVDKSSATHLRHTYELVGRLDDLSLDPPRQGRALGISVFVMFQLSPGETQFRLEPSEITQTFWTPLKELSESGSPLSCCLLI